MLFFNIYKYSLYIGINIDYLLFFIFLKHCVTYFLYEKYLIIKQQNLYYFYNKYFEKLWHYCISEIFGLGPILPEIFCCVGFHVSKPFSPNYLTRSTFLDWMDLAGSTRFAQSIYPCRKTWKFIIFFLNVSFKPRFSKQKKMIIIK
jgi:hypothetical protein